MRAVVIGTGQVGFAIIGALAEENADVVAIDLDAASLDKARELFDIQTIHGSGSNPFNLETAGVASADMVVAVTDSDEVNMVACSIASMKAPHAIKVARIREGQFIEDEAILGQGGFGVNHAINPELVTAQRLEDLLNVPFATDVAELYSGMKLVGMRLTPASPVAGRTFAELPAVMPPDLKILVTSRIRQFESIVPGGTDDLQPGDLLYVVVAEDDLEKLSALCGKPWKPARRIVIAGGGWVGGLLAAHLEKNSRASVKVIESDPARANELAEKLSKILVLQGSSTDENLLLEENIRDCDVLVAALSDEESNVMTALNAKRLGAGKVIALTNKTGYIPIIENAGVDAVVSPQALAIGTILHHMRQGLVKSVTPYGLAGKAHILEFEALDTAKVVGKELRKVKLPPRSIIGLLVRDGNAIIPGGADVIIPGDRVFVVAEKGSIRKLEKLFTVSLHFF